MNEIPLEVVIECVAVLLSLVAWALLVLAFMYQMIEDLRKGYTFEASLLAVLTALVTLYEGWLLRG